MATTTQNKVKAPFVCGYCITGAHSHCPHAVRNGNGLPLQCHCPRQGCGNDVILCLECKMVHDDVSSRDWRCLDRSACAARVQARLDGNPSVQNVLRHKENATMAETATKAETKEKAEKAPKEKTYCLVTGKETKGGKFAPGMDARYVSMKVADTIEHPDHEADNKSAVYEISDSLGKKFEKSLGIARDKAEAKVKREQEKAAAAEAKAHEAATDAAEEAVAS